MSHAAISGFWKIPHYFQRPQISSRAQSMRGPAQFISFGPDTDSKNEYDPLKPNDYEKMVRGERAVFLHSDALRAVVVDSRFSYRVAMR